jgi:hypothetical protein
MALASTLAALLAGPSGGTAQAQGRGSEKGAPAGKETARKAGRLFFVGKITSVNASKNQLVLGDVHWGDKGRSAGTGTGTAGTKREAGTGGTAGTGKTAGTRRTAGSAGTAGTGRPAATRRTLAVTLGPAAVILLDGRPATLADLKAGFKARVTTLPAGTEATGRATTGAETPGTGAPSRPRTRKPVSAGLLTATRVEAFSKAAPGTSRGSAKERR